MRTTLTLCLAAGLTGILSSAAPAQDARIAVATLPKVGQVDPRFQSYNVEMAEIVGGRFWAPYPQPGAKAEPENTKESGGLAMPANMFRQRPPADLSNTRLRNLARALGPAYVRVSGSWANSIFFQDDDKPAIAPPKGFQNVLTRAQWAGVVAFAKAVDARLTMSFPVSPGARDASGNWDPEQTRKILHATRALGGHVYAAELINEPNLGGMSGLPANYSAASFAQDIARFSAFAKAEAPDLKTVGPGSTGETSDAMFADRLKTDAMLRAEPRPRFDIFAYHFYGARSERCARLSPGSGIRPEDALGEAWLGRTDKALAFYKGLRDTYMPGTPIWLNETAQASCGGDRWAASFLDSFRYVNQMGTLAKQGVSAIFHNTLAASDYALVDSATLAPRPSYWAAVLWRRLMGEGVLDTGAASRPGLHVYAHCLRGRPGGVALVALNLDRDKAASLALPVAADRYALTADDLQGTAVKLNGRTLALAGDALPPLPGAPTPAGNVTLAPASITYLALPTAGNAACR